MSMQLEHYDKVLAATHSYIGITPCGCVVAAAIDAGDKETAKHVQEFMKQGLTIECVTNDQVRSRFTVCTCGGSTEPTQGEMYP